MIGIFSDLSVADDPIGRIAVRMSAVRRGLHPRVAIAAVAVHYHSNMLLMHERSESVVYLFCLLSVMLLLVPLNSGRRPDDCLT